VPLFADYFAGSSGFPPPRAQRAFAVIPPFMSRFFKNAIKAELPRCVLSFFSAASI